MDFSQLKYFITAIDERNLTRAADRLHLTQPALSRSLAKLAAEMNVPLITYKGRTLLPTQSGQELYDWAKTMLDEYAALKHSLQENSKDDAALLTIGLSGAQLSTSLLSKFQYEHLNITLRTETFKSGEFYDCLNRMDIDCVVASELFTRAAVNKQFLYTERLNVVVASDHPLSDLDEVSIMDLKDEDFIFPPKNRLHYHTLTELFKKAEYTPNVKASVDTQVRLSLIRHGVGITLWANSYTKKLKEMDDVKVIHLKEPWCSRNVYLYWNDRAENNKNFQIFKKFLKDTLA